MTRRLSILIVILAFVAVGVYLVQLHRQQLAERKAQNCPKFIHYRMDVEKETLQNPSSTRNTFRVCFGYARTMVAE